MSRLSRKQGRKTVLTNGRSADKSEQYIKISHALLSHHNFRMLNGTSVKVLLEICLRHNGFNNGKIAVSASELMRLLSIGKETALRSLRELELLGFIRKTAAGYFTNRKASEYEVTFFPDVNGRTTNLWGQKPHLKESRRKSRKKQDIFSDTALECHMRRLEN